MESTTINWAEFFDGLTKLVTAIAAIYLAYLGVKIKNEQSEQKDKLDVVIDETKEVKHLVNSTQTNLQTSIDDLRAENKGLREDRAATLEVQDVKIVNDPKVPSESVPVVTAETPTEEGE